MAYGLPMTAAGPLSSLSMPMETTFFSISTPISLAGFLPGVSLALAPSGVLPPLSDSALEQPNAVRVNANRTESSRFAGMVSPGLWG